MPNLTPSEIAEIEKKAEAYMLQLTEDFTKGWSLESKEKYRLEVAIMAGNTKKGYLTAKLEDAAEIKRLREGIQHLIDLWSIDGHYVATHLQQFLNSQP